MFLGAITAVSLPSVHGYCSSLLSLPNSTTTCFSPNLNSLWRGSTFSSLVLARKRDNDFAASASNEMVNMLSEVLQLFEEVKEYELIEPVAPDASLCRHNFSRECEHALNEQINVEYSVSYVYHSLFAYFDRDNVALEGLAKFFKEASLEERGHAEKLMKYLNKRGGRVKLYSIEMPPAEFDHDVKGDALNAMELALSLEKLTYDKLLKVHRIAYSCNDPQLTDFIEVEFLDEQVEVINKISQYVAQLRRVGIGHGVYYFDQMLLLQGNGAA